MNFDPITLDEVRRQAEATRADVAALSAAVQNNSVIKKVQRGVVTPTSSARGMVSKLRTAARCPTERPVS